MRKILLPLAFVCLTGNQAFAQAKDARSFYQSGITAPAHLPEDGIFPHGRTMAFMGYSGDPARDLAAGFTVAGPVYGDQLPYLEKCSSHGWPVVAHVGPRVTFKDGDPAKYKPDPPALRAEVAKQMADLVSRKNIIWWAIHPEELRPWRADEMLYLETVAAAIRENDPLQRPVFLYNPNHRDAASLTPIARHVDVVGKGSYVNSSGKKRDRAWVRWGIEQELGAIQAAGRKGSIALLMPELCQDPPPEEDKEISAWVRHDIYLGMASGAQGVNIWSLFKRREVKRTWQIWYDAYSACAKELNGPRGLSQVFLFGQRRSDFTITSSSSSAAGTIELGGSMEPETSSPQESAKRQVATPSWTSVEIAYENSRYIFLINSANHPASFTLKGWPNGSIAEDAFTASPRPLPSGSPLRIDLPAYGVSAFRFTTGS
ncbi:MAG: hypothetical protein MUF13_06710 [Akkermansiaceae bacterium]|nr:hypothetical protein [Akkermansiaceae bacterium]